MVPQIIPAPHHQLSNGKSISAGSLNARGGSDSPTLAQASKRPALQRQCRYGVCLRLGRPFPLLDGDRLAQPCKIAAENTRPVCLVEHLVQIMRVDANRVLLFEMVSAKTTISKERLPVTWRPTP